MAARGAHHVFPVLSHRNPPVQNLRAGRCERLDCAERESECVMPEPSCGGQVSGELAAIRGSVVDIRFPAGALPDINEGIAVTRDLNDPLIAEVQQHLDSMTVRAMALDN